MELGLLCAGYRVGYFEVVQWLCREWEDFRALLSHVGRHWEEAGISPTWRVFLVCWESFGEPFSSYVIVLFAYPEKMPLILRRGAAQRANRVVDQSRRA